MKNQKINVYLDMDGVMADFNSEPNAIKRFKTEKGFFRKLKPMNEMAIKNLINNPNINLFILSASPHVLADKDKKAWLNYYYPQIKNNHIIIMRNGKNKADYMKTKKGILLDDYGKNCEQWRERGNVAIQVKKPLLEHFHEFLITEILDY